MMMGTSSNSCNLNQNHHTLFTAAQWEELEQQALIYKYMVSGVPVPTDLILSVRRSLYNSSFSSSSSHQPTLGVWEGGFQLYGYGRKVDLEPGRCRRTDGKKWRCSKEAYPDSKYCERHMHRGRNRSRKPVEFSSSSSTATTTLNVSSSSTTNPQLLPNQTNSSSYSHQTLKDYRYLQGMKDLGETYFQLNDPYTSTQKMPPHHQHNYSHFNLKEQQQNKGEETHCFVDFIKSSEEPTKSTIHETTSKQPFHHFFSPPKTTPNPAWVEVDQHQHQSQLINPPKSPLSTQDLFQSKPRPYWSSN